MTSSKNIIYWWALRLLSAQTEVQAGLEEDALKLTGVRCKVMLFKLYITGVVVVLYLYMVLPCLQQISSFF